MSIVEIHRGMIADLAKWIDAEGLSTHLQDEERAFLEQSIGQWSRETAVTPGRTSLDVGSRPAG